MKCAAIFTALALSAILPAHAQKKQAARQETPKERRPDPSEEIKTVADRIYNYLETCTPASLTDENGKEIKDYSLIDKNSSLKKGDFSIISYEWGVTYSGMLALSEVTGDEKYAEYATDRFKFLGEIYPYVQKYGDETGYAMKLYALRTPRFLDDCGAMCTAMIKATLKNPFDAMGYRALLNNWFNFVEYKEYRLGDGILARNRPAPNSVWLDDMYMGITPIAYRAKLSQKERGDLTQKFYAEAVNQIELFKKYLWIPEKNLYRHGWIEGMSEHPDYHWARANAWAMLTLCDVLDVLPEWQQGRDAVLEQLRSLIRGIAPLQSPEGRWHQLLDIEETYLETSASAIFVYCIAHAVNRGWIDRTAYQDIARSGWNAVAAQVNEKGQVENTCVGTGLGWTNTFYANRPLSVYAAHGYGPTLLAAAEMLKMYGDRNRQNADSGSQPVLNGKYENNSKASASQSVLSAPVFNGLIPGMEGYGGTVREEGKPMIFLAGDSTCKNGMGDGSNGQWGWGSFFKEYTKDCTVENDALGGLSSRTFFNGSNWARIRDNIKEGDFVLIQFGHNDMSPINSGRARGTLSGTSDEPQTFVMEKNGGPETVYSYGHYIRMMVRQTLMRGGIPIVLSPTPQNSWTGENEIKNMDGTYNAWCETVAGEEGVTYVNVNDIVGSEYEKLGKTEAQKDYFADGVHTKEKGARLYCLEISEALKKSGNPIAKYMK